MEFSWKPVSIGDLGRVVTGRTPPGARQDYFGESVPFLTPTDMDGRRKVEITARSLSPQGAHLLDKVIVPRGVAVSCIGWQMGKAILVDRPTAANQQINTIIPDTSRIHDLFLYYALTAKRHEIFALGAGGSRTPILNKTDFEKIMISVPPLAEQRAIAHILGTLDDKIELNRRMNETLEEMARAIFKSWFVDFDPVRAKAEGLDTGLPEHIADLFPDSFEDSELGEIPARWNVRSFADTVSILGGGTPKTSVAEYWSGDIPWYSVVDTPRDADVFVIDTQKKTTQAGIKNSSTRILPTGTSIISARGTVGRVALVGTPMAMNQSCYGLRDSVSERGYYTYFATRNLVAILRQRVHGAVFDTITRDTLRSVSVAVPPRELVGAFEKEVGPLLIRILVNRHQSKVLASIRDALLPRLISGELRVPETEQN
jgi:type I restriction enzyme, S subunit